MFTTQNDDIPVESTQRTIIFGALTDDEIERVCQVKNLPRDLVEPVQNMTGIPLLRGTTTEERQALREHPEPMTPPLLAMCGTLYTPVGDSGNYSELRRTLSDIQVETNEHAALVILHSFLTGQYSLERALNNGIAAAGMNQ